MPPKATQTPKKPRRKQPQNTRQVRRPARGSNKNPCLNNDESQVGRPSEQTNNPMLVEDRLSLTMYEEEMYLFDEDGPEVERLPSPHDQHPRFIQPTHQEHLPEHSSAYSQPLNHSYQQLPVGQTHPQYSTYSTLEHALNPYLQHQQPYQQLPAHQPQGGYMFQCSIDTPPPPTVHGAERLSDRLRDEQIRPMRTSPYPLPGLRKVSVFGPCRIDEGYRGQWQNTGVIYNVAPKHPTARDLPRMTLPPLDITVPGPQQPTPAHPLPTQSRDATHPRNDSGSSGPQQPTLPHSHPIQSHNDTGSSDAVPPPAARAYARACRPDNGVPTNEENIAMARAALSDTIATHVTIPPGRYYLPDEDKFIISLTKITNTLRTARTVVLFAYDLELDIWDTSCEITHKQNIVPMLTTHSQCLFKMQEMMIGGVLKNVPVLEHTALIHVVMDILWVNGFYKDLDLQDLQALDGVIALTGAAICSAIQEYEMGVWKRINFSTAKSKSTYTSIKTYMTETIYTCIELTARFHCIKVNMKNRGVSRTGIVL
ncbi:hypothetical protein C8R48DRAFT_773663 [Suillus tomentosus]|nr:hypothetical protein C8R48DRAFT_773663 [Suillus tomentosus]